jgi:hypothetical protein
MNLTPCDRLLCSLWGDLSSSHYPGAACGYTGRVGSVHLVDALRGDGKDFIGRFINASLSVHPGLAGSSLLSSAPPRRDLVRQVQERLQTVEFTPGTIDRAMGPQTQQALRGFQTAQGVRTTGDLDGPTLNAWGIR